MTEMHSVRYFDTTGARRRLRCASREEAEFERARLNLEASRGQLSAPPGRTILAEFWPLWLSDARGRLARSTVQTYERLWDRRLRDRFGSMPLDAIKPRMVSQWRSDLLGSGVGPEATRYAMVLLQAIFTIAIEWGEATSNPVSVVRKPRQGRNRAVEPIPPEGVERLRRAFLDAGDRMSATLVCVLAYAGLRPGEALALERRHIRETTILVERALSDGEVKRQKTGRLYRTVDLLPVLAADLAAWAGDLPVDALLFPTPRGTAWTADDWKNWRNRRFHRTAAAVGLGRPRPYDLRHSFASLMIREQRTSIVELADQLGHAPTMTLNTYAHVFAEYRRTEPIDANDWIEKARAALVSA